MARSELIKGVHEEKSLSFLITLAFTNNGREHTSNACELLWDIQDYLAALKKTARVVDCYNQEDACNQKYRNGYNSFKKMYTLHTMYTKKSLSDVRFEFK